MGVLMNGFWTILAVACSTAATAGVLFSLTKYLINDHHLTAKRNEFKVKAKSFKQILKSISNEYLYYKHKIGGESVDETLSSHSGSTAVLSEKSILEMEEGLIRLLERLDSLKLQTFHSQISLLEDQTEKQIEILLGTSAAIITEKKCLVDNIQKTIKDLDLSRK